MAMYITFDPYYSVEDYNSFLNAARNNGIEYTEFIRIRAPFTRYLKIKDKKDLPAFVNYDFAAVGDIKWLVSTVRAVRPNEEYLLKRRAGKDIRYYDFILPNALKEANKEDYIMVFKSQDFTEMAQISKKLGGTPIYKWGESKIKKYKIYYCFNPYISGILSERNKLMEFGDTGSPSQALKHSKVVPKIQGELEYYLNYFVLIKEKLENKTLESEYWQNGKIHPLKKETFIN